MNFSFRIKNAGLYVKKSGDNLPKECFSIMDQKLDYQFNFQQHSSIKALHK